MTKALRGETRDIPVVFVVVSDPVGDGLVDSLGRPGGNVTGFTNVESSFGSKWVGLLREVHPRLTQVTMIYSPKTAPGGGQYYWQLVEDAARSIGIKATRAPIQGAADIERVLPALAGEKGAGLVVAPDLTTLFQPPADHLARRNPSHPGGLFVGVSARRRRADVLWR